MVEKHRGLPIHLKKKHVSLNGFLPHPKAKSVLLVASFCLYSSLDAIDNVNELTRFINHLYLYFSLMYNDSQTSMAGIPLKP